MVRLSFGLLLLPFLYGAEEKCDFDSHRLCIKQARETSIKKLQEKETSDVKELVQCMKTAQCKDPEKPVRKPMSADSDVRNGRRKCLKDVQTELNQQVEKCVEKTVPDFHFPKREEIIHIDKNVQPELKRFEVLRSVNKSCVEEKAKIQANSCIRNITKARREKLAQQPKQDFKKEICQIRNACLNKLSSYCQQQLNKTKQAICDCGTSIIKTDRVQYENKIKQCQPTTTLSPLTATPSPSKTKNGIKVGKEKRIHEFLFTDFAQKRFCPPQDMC